MNLGFRCFLTASVFWAFWCLCRCKRVITLSISFYRRNVQQIDALNGPPRRRDGAEVALPLLDSTEESPGFVGVIR